MAAPTAVASSRLNSVRTSLSAATASRASRPTTGALKFDSRTSPTVVAHRDLVAGAEHVEVSQERDQGAVPGAEVADIEDE